MAGKLEVAVWAVHALVAVRGREGRHCHGSLCWALSGSFGDTAGYGCACTGQGVASEVG